MSVAIHEGTAVNEKNVHLPYSVPSQTKPMRAAISGVRAMASSKLSECVRVCRETFMSWLKDHYLQ